MFKENKSHLQGSMFGFNNHLSERSKKELLKSEEYAFYELIFRNIREEDFAVLFSENGSRPNAPINAMISAFILHEKKGWSYEELFKQISFNLLTRTALGLDTLDNDPFCQATLFNFQNRLRKHFEKTGENLIEKVFDNLTEKQIKSLKIKTDIQRSDSVLIASNIKNYSRIELLIEVIIRMYKVLSTSDKEWFGKELDVYLKEGSEHYVYKLKKPDLPHELNKLGKIYHWYFWELKEGYGDTEIYQILSRVFEEHFTVVDEKIDVIPALSLNSDILQSPDDLEATYRKKRDKESRGFVLNSTETANPDNQLNLITDVIVEKNNKDDSVILSERIDTIKEKTPDLNELHTDGGYGSKENDVKMEELAIKHVQTAVKGRDPKVFIDIALDTNDNYVVICPYQQVFPQQTNKRWKAEFTCSICEGCPLSSDCPTIPKKKSRVYYFDHSDYLMKKRHKSIESIPADRRKLRPNVEATMNEFTYQLRKEKLKVRGKFKSMMFAFTKAIAINFGRIYRNASTLGTVDTSSIPSIIYSFARILSFFMSKYEIIRKSLCNLTKILFYSKNIWEVHSNIGMA